MMLGCGETSLRLSPPLIVSKEEARLRWTSWRNAFQWSKTKPERIEQTLIPDGQRRGNSGAEFSLEP